MAAVKLTRPLLLEHINLNVPSEPVAEEFYIRALGGARQPKRSSVRIRRGRQLRVQASPHSSTNHLPTHTRRVGARAQKNLSAPGLEESCFVMNVPTVVTAASPTAVIPATRGPAVIL